ncbi:glycosyltransferase [Leifsonia sp. H3M29-4]|uniref:glycosyltransferase n=1 Tax=Salinibacterium metalliresistens TaxID=3031321 RepID=UPI0023D9A5D2|nr:glycosyltransferase [Salinibacterium metalliresistens]MDF1479156.1 glycosyltransferase [Salinibacterium metalliresistens]
MATKRILSISFSPINQDSRVRRQLAVLGEFGEVTTVGYGSTPAGVSEHFEVPASAPSLPQTPGGVIRLALHRYRAVGLRSPGEMAALRLLTGAAPFDLVVANDARALPLAFTIARGAPVWADLHEWAPEENSTSLPWRLLVKPYMDWLCREYLPRASATTTVSKSIADLYREHYGIAPDVVRNAGPLRELTPAPLEPGRIRLVHSGIAVRNRNVESLIDAVATLDDRFSLDLYLVDTGHYLATLQTRAAGSPRIRFREPVAPDDLPATLNTYDLGVFLLPPRTINYRFMLPNKFFDFVQARLGVVFGPAIEIDRIIAEHGIGVVTDGWSTGDLVAALRGLTHDDVARFKAASDLAAHVLSNDADLATQRSVVRRLLGLT